MKSLRLSFIFVFVTFFCVANSNPLLGFLGKSDDKTEAGEVDVKATISTPSMAKAVSETTTTLGSTSSCGGLKDFLHMCDKNKPTESPKIIKTRSVPEKDSDENRDESESEDDDDDSVKSLNETEKKREITETSSVASEPTEGGIVKRQVGDPEAPMLGEVPPVIPDPMELPEKPIENSEEDKTKKKRQAEDSDSSSSSEEDKTKEKRQAEDSDSSSSSEEDKTKEKRQAEDSDSSSSSEEDKTKEVLGRSRRRTDYRRKREFVPLYFERGFKNGKTTEKSK